MHKLKRFFILLMFSLACISGCDSKSLIPEEIKAQLPNESGIAVTFATTWVPNIVQAVTDNLGILVDASMLAQNYGSEDIGLALECENFSSSETRCMMQIDSSQLRFKAKDFLFGLVGGAAFLRRGCDSLPCEQISPKIWWRTLRSENSRGAEEFTLEVCNIEGIEVGLGFSGPLDTIASAIGRFVKGVEIKGLRIKAESQLDVVAQYDAYGTPLRDEYGYPVYKHTTSYKTKSVHVGAGPVGGFPNSNCKLSNPRFLSERDEDDFKDSYSVEEQGGKIPSFTYAKISGDAVKFAVDSTRYISNDAENELLDLSLLCREFYKQDSCKISYSGPGLTIPIPKYITGILDAKMVVNRECSNPGCKESGSAGARLAVYEEGDRKVLELCEINGIEASNLQSFPLQERLFGMPDIKGLKIAIIPFAREDNGPLLDEFRLGISKFGRYPSDKCMIL